MANDYGDQAKYKAEPYNIDSEKRITASGMRTALGTKEDVANKKDTLANSSTEYPSSAAVYAHTSNKNNPHGVTKAQVGLGSADNTSDANKPISTATQTALNGKQALLPVGTILMYDGTGWADNSTLPGWYQCNGKNGTPDLRDKFIRGGRSGENMARGGTGGADSRSITLQKVNLPSHNHSLTALTLGNESAHTHSVSATTDTKTHSHTFSGNNLSGDTPYFQMDYSRTGTNNTNGIITSTTQVGGSTDSGGGHDTCASFSISFTPSGTINGNGSHAHSFTATSGAGSGHTHSLSSSTISNTGSGTAFTVDTVPTYYSMIYIRRCA
ncbi:phage tail fiber protein [Candidatus Termititenax persephonae]|uniref:Phage tail fiber protein n=1 Tax=Candidatus Termititenax persephonae TaxID=2218525 RepID=A0A388TEY3_9BACT|nr:phage tail fiber protein [Candidatus Termititenax persephonae]